MKEIVFGGIYIISGLLSAIVFYLYDITLSSHDFGFISVVSIISIIVGIVFTIKGLCGKKEERENKAE